MSLIDDIHADLLNAGLTDVYASFLPDTDGEAIAILDTGGTLPDGEIPNIKEPTFQVLVRANDYTTGKTRIDSVRSRLHGEHNRTIGDTYFYFIHAQSEPGHIGRNERGQDEFSINFICKTR